MAVTIKIVEDNKKEILGELEEAIDRALESVGLQAESYAKLGCPVDTGLLRNSITHALHGQPPAISKYKADKGNASGSYSGAAPNEPRTVFVGTNVEYAPYAEAGHALPSGGTVAGAHFLERAVMDHSDEYGKLIESALKGFQ